MEELLHGLRREGTHRVGRSAQILEKYLLLDQFKIKLDKKWQELEGELLSFLYCTEDLVSDFTRIKKLVENQIEAIDDGRGEIL